MQQDHLYQQVDQSILQVDQKRKVFESLVNNMTHQMVVGSNLSGHSGVSPLALPSVTDSEKVEKPTSKSVSSLPPIADQTELEDVKEDSTLLDSGKSRKIDTKWESHI